MAIVFALYPANGKGAFATEIPISTLVPARCGPENRFSTLAI